MTKSRGVKPKSSAFDPDVLDALDSEAPDPKYELLKMRQAADTRRHKHKRQPEYISRSAEHLKSAATNPDYWDQAAAFGAAPAGPSGRANVEWIDAFNYYLDHVCIEKIDRRKKTKIAEISLDFAE